MVHSTTAVSSIMPQVLEVSPNATVLSTDDRARHTNAPAIAERRMMRRAATMTSRALPLSSRAAATSRTTARFSPSEANRCSVSAVAVKSEAMPMPAGPRNMATNFPRTSDMSIWNICIPPNMEFPLRMLLYVFSPFCLVIKREE